MKSDTKFLAWLIIAAVVTFVCAVTLCTCLETMQAKGLVHPRPNPVEHVVHAQGVQDGEHR